MSGEDYSVFGLVGGVCDLDLSRKNGVLCLSDELWDGHLEARERAPEIYQGFKSGFYFKDFRALRDGDDGWYELDSRNKLFSYLHAGYGVVFKSEVADVFGGLSGGKLGKFCGMFDVLKIEGRGNERRVEFSDGLKKGLPLNFAFAYGAANRSGKWDRV